MGAFIAPFIVPVLYKSYGSDQGFVLVFVVLALAFAAVAVVVALFGRETKGESLKDISR